MNFSKCFVPLAHSKKTSIAFLVMRIVAGAALIQHGLGKMESPMGWMGPEAPVPGIFQLLAAISEFGGGIALILGLLTPLASFGVFCTMLVAVSFHLSRGDPFTSHGGASYELAIAYLTVALLFLLSGPGHYSVDRFIFKPKA